MQVMEHLTFLPPEISQGAVYIARTIIPAGARRALSDYLHQRPRLPLSEPYSLTVDGVTSRFNIDSYWDWETLSDTGRYNERPFLEVFVECLRRDGPGVVWDVGAAQGKYAVMAAQLGMNVFAFEPYQIYRDALFKNIQLNRSEDRVKIMPHALGNHNNTASLYHGGASPSLIDYSHYIHQTRIEVKTSDALIGDGIPTPTYVKIDAEGWEDKILQGANGLFTSKNRPRHVFIEIHNEHLRFKGTSGVAVIELLQSWNYRNIRGEMIVRGSTSLYHFVRT